MSSFKPFPVHRQRRAVFVIDFTVAFDAHVDAIVVGSLGSWYPSNDAALAQMGVSRKYAKLMRKLICSDTIRWSRNIYIQHLTDKKQY
ncbi:hypothetical protein NPIL_109371 [Nephila pilipes]|uniref:Uncharacterized protein n=1 Tax=Nephila pilipes TaxID=299642 RepID=A0A8X6QBN6_NEPPI|nr:hypothetical protein NPIL_109371 [Nephila pilipes]